ncbi:MAG: hypothetical protein AAGH15_25615, partial [Myxococcota bacterium]
MPRAVHRGRGTAARVLWCDGAATARGVRPGQTLAAARARSGDLASRLVDAAALSRARRDVIAALLEISPRIAAGHDASPATAGRFWAEPPRVRHVREGRTAAWASTDRVFLEGWAHEAHAVLPPRYGAGRVAIGPTAAVAWAAALSPGADPPVVSPDEARAFLDGAPLEVLELPPEHVADLRALGIRDVAALR